MEEHKKDFTYIHREKEKKNTAQPTISTKEVYLPILWTIQELAKTTPLTSKFNPREEDSQTQQDKPI